MARFGLRMAVGLLLGGLLVACKGGDGGGGPQPPPGPPDLPSARADMLSRHNGTRAAGGVPILTENPLLDQLAQAHAEYMAATATLTHVDASGGNVDDRATAAGYNWTNIGENIAFDVSAVTIYNAWLGSSGHYNNIVNPSFTEIGMGRAILGVYQYWCVVFGNEQP